MVTDSGAASEEAAVSLDAATEDATELAVEEDADQQRPQHVRREHGPGQTGIRKHETERETRGRADHPADSDEKNTQRSHAATLAGVRFP